MTEVEDHRQGGGVTFGDGGITDSDLSGTFLITITGADRPGLSRQVFGALSGFGDAVDVTDVEQIHVHGQVLLCVELCVRVVPQREVASKDGLFDVPSEIDVRQAIIEAIVGGPDATPDADGSSNVSVVRMEAPAEPVPRQSPRQHVTVLAPDLGAKSLAGVSSVVTQCGGNIDRIVRLSRYPIVSYELVVSDVDPGLLRRELGYEAARLSIDLAVQDEGLHRRAKHLIVLDADSTLFQGEVIDLLAERAGCGEAVQKITSAAMAGELDFKEAMEMRLELLAGVEEAVLDAVAGNLRLAPGARTLVRTLHRLGYVTAVVSGGFTQVITPVATAIGIDHVAANELEMVNGKLTGRMLGPLLDRQGKADALRRIAQETGVPMRQTIAVGDGANDLDMLSAAGLGIAFNAKPVVREHADMALNVPYLDAILFLLGISRAEIEAADTGDLEEI